MTAVFYYCLLLLVQALIASRSGELDHFHDAFWIGTRLRGYNNKKIKITLSQIVITKQKQELLFKNNNNNNTNQNRDHNHNHNHYNNKYAYAGQID
jgi:ABC-type Zn2+ transport system substrate-binding protein/surface adhesin